MESPSSIALTVANNKAAKRFEATWNGRTVWIDYEDRAGVYSLVHTEVPDDPTVEGTLVDALTSGAFDIVRLEGGRVISLCPLTQEFVRRNPRFRALEMDLAEPEPTMGQRDQVRLVMSRDVDLLSVILREADEDQSRIRRVLTDDRHTGYLAVSGGHSVGAAVVRWQQAESEIEYIAVVPGRRCQGLGRALVNALLAEARRWGVPLLSVGTDNTSLDNVAFYQKCGFRMDSVRRDYFKYLSPPVVVDGVAMRDMVVLSRPIDIESVATRRFSEITQTTEADLPRLFEIWETSARATHSFLSEEDFQALIPDVKAELAHYHPIFCLREESGAPYAMLGVKGTDIEMLFVHAASRGRGAGRLLVEYAVEALGATTVDVNEENVAALGFYRRMGFEVASRSDSDGDGRPYPVLHLALVLPRVEFREVTENNFKECVELSPGSGRKFVESNLFSLAEARIRSAWQPRAIYAGDQMVGFLMYSWDLSQQELYLARLMIDVRFQSKGYGSASLKRLMEVALREYQCLRIRLTALLDNARAIRLYEKFGFCDAGVQEDGEEVFVLELSEKRKSP